MDYEYQQSTNNQISTIDAFRDFTESQPKEYDFSKGLRYQRERSLRSTYGIKPVETRNDNGSGRSNTIDSGTVELRNICIQEPTNIVQDFEVETVVTIPRPNFRLSDLSIVETVFSKTDSVSTNPSPVSVGPTSLGPARTNSSNSTAFIREVTFDTPASECEKCKQRARDTPIYSGRRFIGPTINQGAEVGSDELVGRRAEKTLQPIRTSSSCNTPFHNPELLLVEICRDRSSRSDRYCIPSPSYRHLMNVKQQPLYIPELRLRVPIFRLVRYIIVTKVKNVFNRIF